MHFENTDKLIDGNNVLQPETTTGMGEFGRSSEVLMYLAATVTIALMVTGLFGNLLTIVALARHSKIRTIAAAFIISLCLADLLFCVTVLPFSASHFLHRTWVHGDFLCSLIPFLRYGNVGVSLLSITMISINRYLLIAWPHIYPRVYTKKTVIALIAFCWIFSYGMQVPTFFGVWGKFGYDKDLGTCSITDDKSGRNAKTPLFVIAFIIPCVIIIGCYTLIFVVVKKSHARLQRHTSGGGASGTEKKTEWNLTKMIFAIFLGFLLCYLPITIVKIADQKIAYPGAHVVGYLLLFLSACINPIIYVTMNKQYRQAYYEVLRCGWTRPTPTTATDIPSRTLMSVVFTPNKPSNGNPQIKIART